MSHQSVSPNHFPERNAPTEQVEGPANVSRGRVASAAVAALQRLVAIGPSREDWQTELEAETGRRCGTPHVVAVASANVALHCVLAASNLKPQDEVIIPAYLPPSIPEVIWQFNAHPISRRYQRRIGTHRRRPDCGFIDGSNSSGCRCRHRRFACGLASAGTSLLPPSPAVECF